MCRRSLNEIRDLGTERSADVPSDGPSANHAEVLYRWRSTARCSHEVVLYNRLGNYDGF